MDSGRVGHMEYETFNAARIDIQINGTSVHPGTAYGRLVNALKIANQIDAALPQAEVPEKQKTIKAFTYFTIFLDISGKQNSPTSFVITIKRFSKAQGEDGADH